jgi:small subunit ribosomal protein S9
MVATKRKKAEKAEVKTEVKDLEMKPEVKPVEKAEVKTAAKAEKGSVKTEKDAVKEEKTPKGKYFYAVGRRKSSVAQVRIYPNEKAGDDDLIVNKRKMVEYFPVLFLQNIFVSPLKLTEAFGKFGVSVLVRGGGFRGQAEAIKLGISKALVEFNPEYKKKLKEGGFMTRDSRVVERKKPGLKKARKAPQWAKR